MPAHTARCIISRQSIAEGEVCRVMPIVQAAAYRACEVTLYETTHRLLGGANTTAYPDCFWKPEAPFLRAIYDDYGMSTLILETQTDRVLAANLFTTLFHECGHTAAGENRSHDLEVNFKGFVETKAPGILALTELFRGFNLPVSIKASLNDAELQACWTYLCDMIRRHRVFVSGSRAEPRPLQLCFVHETAYQAMLEHTKSQKDWDGHSLAPADFARRALQTRLAEAKKEYDSDIAAGEPVEEARRSAISWLITSDASGYHYNFKIRNAMLDRLFSALAIKVYEGALTEDQYVAEITPLLSDAAVGIAMQYFDLKLEPATYVMGDDLNKRSQAYIKLAAKVATAISNSRK